MDTKIAAMTELERLTARAEIADAIARYARGVDRRDWKLVRSTFHDDAHDEHGSFAGGPDGFIEWVSDRHATLPFSMHFLGNSLIEFTGRETAAVETYFIAMQRREPQISNDEMAVDVEIFGRYVDKFERRDGNWKVAARRVVYDSSRTQPSTDHLRTPSGTNGRRSREDVSYHLFATRSLKNDKA